MGFLTAEETVRSEGRVSKVREQGAVVGRGRASWEGSGGGRDEKGGSGVRRSRNGGE